MTRTWKEEIQRVVIEAGGPISLSQIYACIECSQLVTTRHQQPWKSGGQPRYQCQIRRELTNLCRDGAIRRVGRGLYAP